MRRFSVVIAMTAVAAMFATAGPVAAADPTHLTGSFTFDSVLCGFAGTTHVGFIDNFGSKADGSSYDSGQVLETFVASNGRGVTIFFAGHEYNYPPVVNADGSVSFAYLYSEAQFKIQALNGPILQQNAGRILVTLVLAADGSFVSLSIHVLAGPNPNTTGDENSPQSCSVIAPYLAG